MPQPPLLHQRRHHIEIERLPSGTGLLAALQHRDRPHAGWQGLDQQRRREGPEQPHLHHPHPFPGSPQPLGGGLGGLAGRTHQQHQPLRIGGAHVLIGAVAPATQGRKLFHRLHHQARHGRVGSIHRFATLEINVWVLGGAPQHRPGRVEGPLAVGRDRLLRHQGRQQAIGQRLHLLDFMGGAKSIEQVQKRQPPQQRGPHGDGSKIPRLLHRSRAENRATSRAASHHIAVVAKDREALGRQGPTRHLHHHRQALPRPAVEVGEHQQQTLRRRKCGCQGSGLQGSVHGPGRPALALKLHHARRRPPEIGPPLGAPAIGPFAHRRGRRDRVDGDHLMEAIGHPRYGFIAIDADGGIDADRATRAAGVIHGARRPPPG